MSDRVILLAEIAREFEALIRRPRVPEGVVHDFLVKYPALIPVWQPHENVIFSKLKMGSQHECDFAHVRENTPGATWHLFEIERPHCKMFTKGGNPSAILTHAMRQLFDWSSWFIENRSYVANSFPFRRFMQEWGLAEPELILIMGRRSEVDDSDRRLLQRLQGRGIKIMTYDRLLYNLSRPAFEESRPLRMCRFAAGKIDTLSQMRIEVRYYVSDGPKAQRAKRNNPPSA